MMQEIKRTTVDFKHTKIEHADSLFIIYTTFEVT